jgi:hypothetical protein
MTIRPGKMSEDSALASFAGEFETVLDVRMDEEIRQAIHVVRRSRHSCPGRKMSSTQGSARQPEKPKRIVHPERWVFKRMCVSGQHRGARGLWERSLPTPLP